MKFRDFTLRLVLVGMAIGVSVTVATATAIAATPVTSTGVAGSGFPVALTTAGATYQLTENISCPTTCFTVKAANITIDLNGYTATFGTANNPEMKNTGFESWLDPATPANWSVLSGTMTQKPAIQWGTYDAELSATAVIKSDPVMLKAGQTYVYYAIMKGSSSDSYTLSLRSAADDTVLATTTITGNYLNRSFAMPDGSLTAAENQFKPTADTQVYLRVDSVGTALKRLHVVDIKPARHYFVASNNYRNTTLYPDLADALFGGTVVGVLIKNGTINQGIGNAVKSAAIYSGGVSGLQNLMVRMSGNNTTGASVGANVVIDTVTFDTASILNFNRMHSAHTLVLGNGTTGHAEIKNSTFLNDPEISIGKLNSYLSDTDTHTTHIHHNVFRHRQYCTEGYAIAMSGVANVTIENNDINPLLGRGILLDAVANRAGYLDGTKNVTIRNNTIRNIYEKSNAEYGPESMEAVGIRIREFKGESGPQEGHRNLQIYGNTIDVFVNAEGTHRSYGLNILANVSVDSIDIYDNTITATLMSQATPDWKTACIAFQGTDATTGGKINIRNNICSSNDEGIRFGGNDGAGTIGVNIFRNKINAKYGFFFFGYPGSPAMPFKDLSIYENIIENGSGNGYPFFFENLGYTPVVENVFVSNNSIINANTVGAEVFSARNYSTGFIVCGNGQVDVTGGGVVGTALDTCRDGVSGGWSAAGLTTGFTTGVSAPIKPAPVKSLKATVVL